MNKIEFGDCRDILRRWAAEGVRAQMCVTSPPYFGLRNYGVDGQLGLEQTPEQYVAAMVEVFRCVWDVLADDGTLWLNIGDSYFSTTKGTGGTAVSASMMNRKSADSAARSIGRQGMEPIRLSAGNTGCKPKDLIGIPWRLAFALQADGWFLRQDIIWHKPNPMPESVRDRCTKAHEYVFLLTKSERYFFDCQAMKEPAVSSEADIRRARITGRGDQAASANYLGSPQRDKSGGFPQKDMDNPTRNRRSVWSVATRPYKGAHFATFPPALIEPCILAGSRPGDIVIDPFIGSGTTAAVSLQHGRQYLGCELNPEYGPLQDERISKATPQQDPQMTLLSDAA